jgi:hypothetical protein
LLASIGRIQPPRDAITQYLLAGDQRKKEMIRREARKGKRMVKRREGFITSKWYRLLY